MPRCIRLPVAACRGARAQSLDLRVHTMDGANMMDALDEMQWQRAAANLQPKFNASMTIVRRHQQHQASLIVALGTSRWRRKVAANAEHRSSSQATGGARATSQSIGRLLLLSPRTIAASHAAASRIAATFRGRQARKLLAYLRNTHGQIVFGKIKDGDLKAEERWQLRGMILAAVRVHGLRQRAQQRQSVGTHGGAPETAGISSSQPNGVWSLARNGLVTDMGALRDPSKRLADEQADVEVVVEVAAKAADHRWRVAQFSTNFTSAARLLHESSFRRLSTVEGGVTTQVESKDAAAALRRWQQGDEEHYEGARLMERFKNRNHPQVRKQLNKWWDWTHQRFSDAVSENVACRLLMTINQRMYTSVMLLINRALLDPDETWDQEEAEDLIEQAWLSDTHGRGKYMNRTEWNDSLFELTDMWTLTTESNEYAEFLERLLDHVRDLESHQPGSFVWVAFGLSEEVQRSSRHTLGREREARSNTHRLFRSAQLIQGLWRKKQVATQYKMRSHLIFKSAQLIQGMLRTNMANKYKTQMGQQLNKRGSNLISESSPTVLAVCSSSTPSTHSTSFAMPRLMLHARNLVQTKGLKSTSLKIGLPNIHQDARYMKVKQRPPSSLRQRSATALFLSLSCEYPAASAHLRRGQICGRPPPSHPIPKSLGLDVARLSELNTHLKSLFPPLFRQGWS